MDPDSPPIKRLDEFDGDKPRKTIVITGAAGNLGSKAARHLLSTARARFNLIMMDTAPCPEEFIDDVDENGLEYVQCDFTKFDDAWVNKIRSSWAAFLFAAKHPQPDASSKDVISSMTINANILEACTNSQVNRVIFASSNHVMGGMLNENGMIEANAKPKIGTTYSIHGASMDSTLYASAKVAAESQLQAMIASGRLPRAIILRIGFCQPGENRKSTLPKTGNPSVESYDEEEPPRTSKDEMDEELLMDWWRGMYLSNRDLCRLVDRCLAPELDNSSKNLLYVNGVSRNENSRWVLENNDLGYKPAEHVHA